MGSKLGCFPFLAASISKPVNKVQCSHEGGTGVDEAFGFVTSTWFVEFDDEFNGLPYSVCPMEMDALEISPIRLEKVFLICSNGTCAFNSTAGESKAGIVIMGRIRYGYVSVS